MNIDPKWIESIVVAVLGFFIVRYIKGVDISVQSVKEDVKSLFDRFVDHEKDDIGKFASHGEQLKQVDRELGRIRDNADDVRTPAGGTPVFRPKRGGG